jgi:hypothetical protein
MSNVTKSHEDFIIITFIETCPVIKKEIIPVRKRLARVVNRWSYHYRRKKLLWGRTSLESWIIRSKRENARQTSRLLTLKGPKGKEKNWSRRKEEEEEEVEAEWVQEVAVVFIEKLAGDILSTVGSRHVSPNVERSL